MAERLSDEEILEGARRVLTRLGARRATLEQIAKEAGVSRVTLHRRGVTRASILAELGQRAAQSYREALWPALTAAGTGLERLERALEAICEVAEANLALLLALQQQSDAVFHDTNAPDGMEIATRSAFTDPLQRLLLDGQSDGTIRAIEPLETATLLFNQVGWTYVHLRAGHRWAPDKAKQAVVASALHGIAAS